MPPMPKPKPRIRLRADGANEDDPGAGGALVGNCGRKPDESCGMISPSECSIHGGTRAADDEDKPDDEAEEKAVIRALRRLIGGKRRAEGDEPDGDEPPVAHEDAIRLAHKSMRTAKAFMTEAMGHHAKAVDLLAGVVEALDDSGSGETDDEPPTSETEPDEDDAEKAKRLKRAQDRARRLASS